MMEKNFNRHIVAQITALQKTIERDRAQMIVGGTSGEFSAQVQKILYYPYHWFHFEYDVKTLLGKRTIQAFIMVDLINNRAHTADRFEFAEIEVPQDNVLKPDFPKEAAKDTAGTYLLHSSIHEMKALLCPEKRIVDERMTYKPFWIVRCVNFKNETFRVMVDAMTGKHQIIN